MSKAFTPRRVQRLRPQIVAIADGLLDGIAARGELDLIEDFAAPLPVIVIATLLVIPDAERGSLERWADDLVLLLDRNTKSEGLQRAATAALEMADRVRAWIEDRRAAPREDLLSALLAARERDDALDEDELISTCVLLLAAGHQTNVNLIGNGMLALLRHPDQLEALRSSPGHLPAAVEELLRYDSPLQRAWRRARVDMELGGKRIAAGDDVVLVLGAANRDPAAFPDPDRLDVARCDNRPRLRAWRPLLSRRRARTAGSRGRAGAPPPPPPEPQARDRPS